MSSSTARAIITTLPRSLLKFPPSNLPATLPPPSDHPNLAHPFTISSEVYNGLLSANVPITVALVYVSLVAYFNGYNARRHHKPWAISRTWIFHIFVLVHNVVLAAYSAWTFVGMINALRLSVYNPRDEYGLAGVLDSVCKLNGPRGLGDAATYNSTTSAWGLTNRVLHLAADGLTPESTDVGRLWNEGLAFYGWLFYVSKYYEIIDTLIILAKGRKSSFLQSYHHAGAMLSMWAGIRYMSPPIWMFVLVNSGLHTVMYTYYALSTVSIRLPKWFKQTLTTLQITQMVVGVPFAFAHLFIGYQIPTSVPYLYHLGDVASAVTDNFASAASAATATASAGAISWLKKAAFRAAGREGLAENVLNEQGQVFGVDAVHAAKEFQARTETRYRDEMQWVHCLDTSGQVFAVLLNCMYLAPLAWLFLRFFVRAYTHRIERRRSSTASEKARAAGDASRDALKGIRRQFAEVAKEGEVDDDEVVITSGKPEKDSKIQSGKQRETKPDMKSDTTSQQQQKDERSAQPKQETGSKDSSEDTGNDPHDGFGLSDYDTKKERNAGKQPSSEVTPELKQDDSFVKVESDGKGPGKSGTGASNSQDKRQQDEIIEKTNIEPMAASKGETGTPSNGGTQGNRAANKPKDKAAAKAQEDQTIESAKIEPLAPGNGADRNKKGKSSPSKQSQG